MQSESAVTRPHPLT